MVTTLVVVWIEICKSELEELAQSVTTLVVVWIEIWKLGTKRKCKKSPLS